MQDFSSGSGSLCYRLEMSPHGVTLSPQALVAHAHTVAVNPVLEQALISLGVWQCLQFPYTWSGFLSSRTVPSLKTKRHSSIGRQWEGSDPSTITASVPPVTDYRSSSHFRSCRKYYRHSGKRLICSYHAWLVCCGKTGNLKSERTIFCLVPSCWLLYLRYLSFEKPF